MADVLLYSALKENARLLDDYIDAKANTLISGDYGYPEASFYSKPLPDGWPYTGEQIDDCKLYYAEHCLPGKRWLGQAGGIPNSRKNRPWLVNAWMACLKPAADELIASVGGNVGFGVGIGFGNMLPTNDGGNGAGPVGADSTYDCFNCGCNCNWTVPAGVTKAVFEMWGPGSHTNTECCCSITPFGGSGAYTIFKMDVVPGEVYCICAGCAICCCAQQVQLTKTCATFITSSNSTARLCVCTNGSQTNCIGEWSRSFNAPGYGSSRMNPPTVNGRTNPSWCGASGWAMCKMSSGGSCGGTDPHRVPYVFQDPIQGGWKFECKPDDRNITCYGLNGLWPEMQLGNGNYYHMDTWSRAPFVFRFEETACIQTYGPNDVSYNLVGGPHPYQFMAFCEARSEAGFMRIPGQGGMGGQTTSSCNACGGDRGRSGRVCVYYC